MSVAPACRASRPAPRLLAGLLAVFLALVVRIISRAPVPIIVTLPVALGFVTVVLFTWYQRLQQVRIEGRL